ncbi:sulfite exporter TauE/SafE family protein [Amycolatopsis cynarae]|uniref:Probable membrane transporter protein n=1 Tax=Amycolatopsis cynarae TaxID=2995223 RepID=A0ABY7ASP9_9PSEU|nr:sulfite exporter TauE/SafE family protein [Amycolatopsis sp. HUAS 11-8]WAL62966.1 sulfite exporter TauE/SafE family protein [Amycolatopsis sp. HUAS 11-8]
MLSLTAAGMLVGFLVGMSGVGGGAVLTPVLVLVFGLSPTAAVSSDLLVAACMKLTGSVVHQRRGDVHWPIVGWLSLGGVPASLLGPVVIHYMGTTPVVQRVLNILLGVILLAVAAVMVVALSKWDPRGQWGPRQVPVRRVPTLLLGAVTGLLVGFTSVGSGSAVAASLLLAYPALRMSAIVATDIVQALPIVVTAAIGHLLIGDFHLSVAWPLLLGSVPAVVVGSLLAGRIPARFLRGVLAVLLAATGTTLLTRDPALIASTAVVAATTALIGSRWRAGQAAAEESTPASAAASEENGVTGG